MHSTHKTWLCIIPGKIQVSCLTCLEIGSERAGVPGHPQQPVELCQGAFLHSTSPCQTPRRSRPALCPLPYLLFSRLPLLGQPPPLPLLTPDPSHCHLFPSVEAVFSCPLHPCFLSLLGCWVLSLQKGGELGWGKGGAEGDGLARHPEFPTNPHPYPTGGAARNSGLEYADPRFSASGTHKGCPLCARGSGLRTRTAAPRLAHHSFHTNTL